MLDGEADFEIRLVAGPEGRELSAAQARAVRGLLEWAAERAREQTREERRAA
jgi:DNA invertase Pin-like site-specific DNA recombinase